MDDETKKSVMDQIPQLPEEGKEMIKGMMEDFGKYLEGSDMSIQVLNEKEEIRNKQIEWLYQSNKRIEDKLDSVLAILNQISGFLQK